MSHRSFAVAALLVGLAVPRPGRADDKAEGRKHLKKAKQLAGKNQCKQALPEFTKAYEALHDAVLLFDRGECYRKTDDKAKALEDYKEFLAQVPTAPNRKTVESRIADLEGPSAAAPVAGPPPAAPPPVPPPPRKVDDKRAPPPVAVASPPPPAASPPPATPPQSKEPLLDLSHDMVPAGSGKGALAEPSFGGPAGGVAKQPEGAAKDDDSVLGKWWFWTVVGVVVVGGAAGAFLLSRQNAAIAPPRSDLGNFKF